MPTKITCQGMLEPVVIEEDFLEAKNAFDLAAARGMEFFSVRRHDNGGHIAFSMRNIVFIEEIDDDSASVLA